MATRTDEHIADSELAPVLGRVLRVRRTESAAVLLAFLYFFFLLSTNYILRPVREALGVAGGVRNLPWLFTGTFLATLIASPLFAALVSRFPRRIFIPATYRFFTLNILVFALLLQLPQAHQVHVGRAFFIWLSVFNLFVVSVFWGFLADLFTSGQGKRLFGFIAAGGTLGGLAGSVLTGAIAETVELTGLLLIAAVMLELAVQCAKALGRRFGVMPTAREKLDSPLRSRPDASEGGAPAGVWAVIGGALAGVWAVMRSPYLLGVCLYVLLLTVTATFLYFQQAAIVEAHAPDDESRTAVFATINTWTQGATLVVQILLTGRIVAGLGVGLTLGLLPAVTMLGFFGLAISPELWMLIGFQVVRSATNYAVTKPAREVLFTVVRREDKYKAKNFIDTFVYRGGDVVGAWSDAALKALSLGIAQIALVAAPLCVAWACVGLALGARQRALAARRETDRAPGAPNS